MRTKTIIRGTVAGALLAAIFGVAQGCSGFSATEYCDKACECSGCPAAVRDVCVSQAQDARVTAGENGCTAEFDAAFTCLSAGECVEERLDASACDGELEALHACDVWIAGTNACAMFSAHIAARATACGVDAEGHGGSPDQACSSSDAKLSACADSCISTLSCDCLESMFNLSAPSNPDCDIKPWAQCSARCTP